MLKRLRQFANKHALKPEVSAAAAAVLEVDEMWHYVGCKKTLWIWKAFDRNTGHLIEWECGRQDKATLQKLGDLLAAANVEVYSTDKWRGYASVFP